MRNALAPAALIALMLCLGCKSGKERSRLEQSVNLAEAKVNLSAVFGSEHAYFARHGTYAERFSDLGWKPEDGHHYAYFLPAETIQPPGGSFEPMGGLKPFVGPSGFTILAVGNIDDDPTLDIWSINDANEVRHVVDDVLF